MKDQYVGDINDYRKYALLRALSAGGVNAIGVCWMLTHSDGGSDGGKLGYLSRPDQQRGFDPPLYDILAASSAQPDTRRLETIEAAGTIPGARYQNDPLPQGALERAAFIAKCLDQFRNCDLIFFDPDNGMEVVSSKLGMKSALSYVFIDELVRFYQVGQSIIVYQHRPRLTPKTKLVADRQAQLHARFPGAGLWVFTTADVLFFLIVHPDSPARLAFAAMAACDLWPGSFMDGRYLGASAQ